MLLSYCTVIIPVLLKWFGRLKVTDIQVEMSIYTALNP